MTTEYIHTAIGVLAVVVDSHRRVLLVLSKDRGWEPPGGFLEVDEPTIAGLKREVMEESGFEVDIVRLTGVYQCSREVPILSLCFLCSPGRFVTDQVEESLSVRWVSVASLVEHVTYGPHLLRIQDAMDSSSAVRFCQYVAAPFSVISSWKL